MAIGQLTQEQIDAIQKVRQQYGDDETYNAIIGKYPDIAPKLNEVANQYGATEALDGFLGHFKDRLSIKPSSQIKTPMTVTGKPATSGMGELRKAEAKQTITPQQKKQVVKEQAIAEFDKTRQWKPSPELSSEENEALRKELGQKQLLRPTGEEALRLGFLFPRKGTPLYEGSGAYKSIMDWVHPHTEEIKKGLTEPYAKSASNAILENELRKTMKGKEYADRVNAQIAQGVDQRTAMVNILKDRLVNNPDKAQINELISNLSSNNAMPTPDELGKDFSKQFLTKHFTKDQAMKQPQAIRKIQETFVSPESSKLSRGEYAEPQSMAQFLMNTPAVVAGDLLANPEDVPGLVLGNYLVGRGASGAMKALPQDLAYIKVTEFFRRPYLAMRGKTPKVKIKPEEAEAMRQTFNESVKVDLDKTAEYMGVDRAYLERGLKRVSKAVESAANGQDVYMIIPWKRIKNAPRVIPRFKINGKDVEVSSQPPQPKVKAIGEAPPEVVPTPEPEATTTEGFNKGDNIIFRNMEGTIESIDPQNNLATINVNGKTYQKNVSELKKKVPVADTEPEEVVATEEIPEYTEPAIKSEAPAIQRQMTNRDDIVATPEPEIPYKVTKADIDAELSGYNAEQLGVAQKAVDDFLQANGGQLSPEQQNRLLQYVFDGKANRLVYDLKVLDVVDDYGNSDKLFADMLADRINIWDIVSPETKRPTEPSVTEPLTMPFGNLPEQQPIEPTPESQPQDIVGSEQIPQEQVTPEQPLPEQAIEQPTEQPKVEPKATEPTQVEKPNAMVEETPKQVWEMSREEYLTNKITHGKNIIPFEKDIQGGNESQKRILKKALSIVGTRFPRLMESVKSIKIVDPINLGFLGKAGITDDLDILVNKTYLEDLGTKRTPLEQAVASIVHELNHVAERVRNISKEKLEAKAVLASGKESRLSVSEKLAHQKQNAIGQIWREHRTEIQQALAEGKPVPESVLADYPDLKATQAEKPNAMVEEGQAKFVHGQDYIPPEDLTTRVNVGKKASQDILVNKKTGEDIVPIATQALKERYLKEGYGVRPVAQTTEAKIKQAFSKPVVTKDAEGNPFKIPQPKRLYDLSQEKNPFERRKAIRTLLRENNYKFPDDIKAGSYVIADDPDNSDLIAQGVGKVIKVDVQDNIADVQFNDALRRVDIGILTNVISPKLWEQQGFIRLPKKPDFLQSRHWKMLKNNPAQRQKFIQHVDTETQLQGGWKTMKQLRQRDVGRATAKLFGEIFGTSIDPILDYDIKRAWKIANDKKLTPEQRMGAETYGILSNRAKSIIRNQISTSGTNGYIDGVVAWDKVKHGLNKNEEMELMYAITEWSQAMTSSIGLKVDPKIGFKGYAEPLLKDLGYNPSDPYIEQQLNNPDYFMNNLMEGYMNGTEAIGKQTPILNPKVLQTLRNYYNLQAEVGDMIVARNVGLNDDDRFSFYFRHNVMEYMTEKINQVITKRGRLKTTLEKQPFLKQRFGTEKGIQTHPDVIIQYLSRAFGSLKFDEAIENMYRETNVWKRGNIAGVWDETDLQMLMDTESWDKFNRNGIEQAEVYSIAGQNFIGATPSNANAKNRTMYLIPLSVYNTLGALTTNSGDLGIMPVLTGIWKQAVLSPIGAGLPYLMLNVYGNLKMLETANIKSFAKLIPFHSTASQFIKKIASGGQLTPDEERLFKEMSRQDVFNSNMLVDINQIRSKTSIPLLKKWWDLNSGFDTLSKVALYMTLDDEFKAWQRKNPGGPYDVMNPKAVFTTAGMDKMVLGLEPEDVKGRIAKQMLIDYPDVSQFFQKGVRGFAVPFATFPLKAIGNYFRYARREPLKFGLKEFLPWILLSAYNWLAQPDTERNIGGLGSRLHFNLFTHTFPDGGTYGFTFAPLAPRDIAFNLLGFNRMYGDFLKWKTLRDSGNGDVYPLSQLLKDWAWDIPTGASRTVMTALSPVIQAPISLWRNRDMRTGKPIVPPSAEVFDDKYNWWHYQAPWLFGQIANPVASFIDAFAVASQSGSSIKANEFTMQVSALDILTDIASQKTGLDLNLPPTARRLIPPLDIVRGMGFYAVNLEKAEQIAQNEIIRNAQEDTARLMQMSEDKVRDMIVKEFTDAQKKGIMELWIANALEAKRREAVYELTGEKPPKVLDINLSVIAEGILDDPSVQEKILQYASDYAKEPTEIIDDIKRRVMTPASLIAMLDQIIVTSKVDLGSWADMKKKAYMRDSLSLGGNIPDTAKEKTIMDMQRLRQSQKE